MNPGDSEASPPRGGLSLPAIVGIGLWIGLLDGYAVLRAGLSTTGGWVERLAVIAVSMGYDVVFFAAAAVGLGVVAWLVAKWTAFDRFALHASLSVTAFLWLLAVLVIEDGTDRAFFRGSLVTLAGAATVVALLVLALIYFGARGKDLPRRHVQWRWTVMAFTAAPLLAAFGFPKRAVAGDDARPNVLFISLDTLRADHLGTYGYERDTSPNLDRLAERGTVFENAVSTANWTLPSHAAMLTGLDPLALGIDDATDHLRGEFITLAERMSESGYRTAAFVGSSAYSYIGGKRGFEQGFDEYHHHPYAPRYQRGVIARFVAKAVWKFVRHGIGTATDQVDAAQRWFWRNGDSPSFVFLHLFDIHSQKNKLPYEAPAPFLDRFDPDYTGDFTGCADNGRCASEMLKDLANGKLPTPMAPEDVERMIALYDGGIAYADDCVGGLFDALEDFGQADRTIVVVTSDHGEAFFDHGVPLHRDLHRENLHVPLIIAAPGGVSGNRVSEVVQTTDIARTLIELSSAASDKPLGRGRSLAPFVLGGEADEAPEGAFAFNGETSALFDGRWKYIRRVGDAATEDGPGDALYDVLNDPTEQENLLVTSPDVAESILSVLLSREEESKAIRQLIAPEDGADLDVPQSTIDELKELGYGG